jgi:signal transduction histidine kinase
MLGTEPEWDKIRRHHRVQQPTVCLDDASVSMEAEYRALQNEYAGLKEAYTRLQEVDHLRQDLVDMIIHDLKNPLSIILGSLEVMAESLGEGADQQLRDLLRIANRSGQEMLQLVVDLLEVQRLESGSVPVHLQPLDIAALLRTVAVQAHFLADKKGLDLCLRVPDGLPWAWGDLSLISRVMTNLLDNAIRFSPRNEAVVVTSHATQRELIVSVSNSGSSIPADQWKRIFDKFFQAGKGPDNERGNVGLGLAFCKLAVEAQRGHIWVESQEGTGVRFSFTLPLWERDKVRPGPSSTQAVE